MSPLCLLVSISAYVQLIYGTNTPNTVEEDDVNKLKQALKKARNIFVPPEQQNIHDSDLETKRIIQHNANAYEKLCIDIELFGETAEKECEKYENEMTDFLRNVSSIPYPPINHTVQWYWAQHHIWKAMPKDFVCFQSDHFRKLIECLCGFCSWPFVIDDEKYDIYTKWKNEYDARKCQQITHKPFMNTGDNMCQWMSIPSGHKGKQIAENIKGQMTSTDIIQNVNSSQSNGYNDTRHIDETQSQSSAVVHLNNVPVLMTFVTVLIMICSALFFLATV
eukprot:296990_1